MIDRAAASLGLALCALAACAPSDEPSPSLPAPEVVDLEQLEALLAAKRGKGLLVNFWATW